MISRSVFLGGQVNLTLTDLVTVAPEDQGRLLICEATVIGRFLVPSLLEGTSYYRFEPGWRQYVIWNKGVHSFTWADVESPPGPSVVLATDDILIVHINATAKPGDPLRKLRIMTAQGATKVNP